MVPGLLTYKAKKTPQCLDNCTSYPVKDTVKVFKKNPITFENTLKCKFTFAFIGTRSIKRMQE